MTRIDHLTLPVWFKVISSLSFKPQKIVTLAKDMNIIYSTAHDNLTFLRDTNLVTREKVGREVRYSLTPQGIEVSNHICEITAMVNKIGRKKESTTGN